MCFQSSVRKDSSTGNYCAGHVTARHASRCAPTELRRRCKKNSFNVFNVFI